MSAIDGEKRQHPNDKDDNDDDRIMVTSEGGGKEQSCPYLDTINRSLLDFDFEHSCSVSLQSGLHVYACLVCGKFFRGKGKGTPAYLHSLDEGHMVFVHLSRNTFHCLPEDYEIRDPSLNDISDYLKPVYIDKEIAQLDKQTGLARDLFGRRYLPGFVGLNNLNKTDYVSATLQALAHVRPLRDFFLRSTTTITHSHNNNNDNNGSSHKKKRKRLLPHENFSPLAQCFGETIRKMWSDKRFKSTVNPHMLVQAISVASKKRFTIGKQAEVVEFIAWLLHQLHIGVGGSTRKPGSSIIQQTFQGVVEITTKQRKSDLTTSTTLLQNQPPKDDRLGSDDEDELSKNQTNMKEGEQQIPYNIQETTTNAHFLQLTLDIPEKPLFKDDDGGLVIPQEPLVSVLKKFDGTSFSDVLNLNNINASPQRRRYRLKKLPNYLILHLTRFKKNEFSYEKNPTIVAFPVKNLDLSQYVFSDNDNNRPPTEEQIRNMSAKEMKKMLIKYGRSDLAEHTYTKKDLVDVCIDFISKSLPDMLANKYDLIANITHNTPAEVGREGKRNPLEEGSYRCHIQHKASRQWYETQDLHVQEIMPQLIGLSESYVLIFERKGM